MNIKATKVSVRTLLKRKRLPTKFRMLIPGSWLFDVLKANSLHEKYRLWNQTYWVSIRSLNTRLYNLTWRVNR